MSQYRTGTVTVTNGSAVVTGSGTLWLTEITPGDIFSLPGSFIDYFVGSVDGDTQITLTANYAGANAAGAAYTITRDFTANFNLPFPNSGDVDVAALLKRAVLGIDGYLKSTGLVPLATFTASAHTAIEFAGLLTSAFRRYTIKGFAMTCASDDAQLRVRLKTSSYQSTSYSGYAESKKSDGTSDNTGEVSLYLPLVADGAGFGITNAAGASTELVLQIGNPADTILHKAVWGSVIHKAAGAGRVTKSEFFGGWNGAAAITGIEIAPSSGTFSGVFVLYGEI